MMPWPFVARSAYVAVCGERDRLAAELAQERERLDRALDHVRRLDRVRRKLPETPAAPKVPDAPLPQVAVEYLEGWAKNSPARAAV